MKRIFFSFFLLVGRIATAGAATEGELRDVKPPVLLPMDFSFWVVILGIVLLIGIAGLVWIFLRRLKIWRRQHIPLPLAPWEMALKRLEELRGENLPLAGRIKEYYSRLSDIVRRYIEERFAIKAPEMTTEEFLFQLRNSTMFGDQQKELLRKFLNGCDLVKFARFQASVSQMEEEFMFVQKFIEQTRPEGVSAATNGPGAVTVPSGQQQNMEGQTDPR